MNEPHPSSKELFTPEYITEVAGELDRRGWQPGDSGEPECVDEASAAGAQIIRKLQRELDVERRALATALEREDALTQEIAALRSFHDCYCPTCPDEGCSIQKSGGASGTPMAACRSHQGGAGAAEYPRSAHEPHAALSESAELKAVGDWVGLMKPVMEELDSSFDQQLYSEMASRDHDPHPDDEFSVNVTAKQLSALSAAVCAAEKAVPVPPPTDEIAWKAGYKHGAWASQPPYASQSAEALLEAYDACWIEDESLLSTRRSTGQLRDIGKRFKAARAAVLAAMQPAPPQGAPHWWCETCKQAVEPVDVTHAGTHDLRHGGCGRYVFWRAAQPPASEPAAARDAAITDYYAKTHALCAAPPPSPALDDVIKQRDAARGMIELLTGRVDWPLMTDDECIAFRERASNYDRLRMALKTVGDDYPGSSCQKWCYEQAGLSLTKGGDAL